jgi:hypothetical protein
MYHRFFLSVADKWSSTTNICQVDRFRETIDCWCHVNWHVPNSFNWTITLSSIFPLLEIHRKWQSHPRPTTDLRWNATAKWGRTVHLYFPTHFVAHSLSYTSGFPYVFRRRVEAGSTPGHFLGWVGFGPGLKNSDLKFLGPSPTFGLTNQAQKEESPARPGQTSPARTKLKLCFLQARARPGPAQRSGSKLRPELGCSLMGHDAQQVHLLFFSSFSIISFMFFFHF